MNGVDQKREFVYKLYPGKKWRARVKKMTDEQVVAIYFREQDHPNHPENKAEPKGESDAAF